MELDQTWRQLGVRHLLWDVLRYYLSIRGTKKQAAWLNYLEAANAIATDDAAFPVPKDVVDLLFEYLAIREKSFADAAGRLRTEQEAIQYCNEHGVTVSKTATKNKDHHQASKALIGAVTSVALSVTTDIDTDPQTRCIWCDAAGLHVTARNLDGAVPSTSNPTVIWEIKEYWGKTKGGSKMSDAVYECHLVGRELIDFEERSGRSVKHAVFVDGKDQWSVRKSDMKRLIDLTYQGLIDRLFVGSDVATEFEGWLRTELGKKLPG